MTNTAKYFSKLTRNIVCRKVLGAGITTKYKNLNTGQSRAASYS